VPFAIETVDLAKRYGPIEALKSLSFAVPEGEVVAFLGPNSAGKTTTLRILAGIMPASFGEATIAGFSAAYQSREVKRHVGYMPEHNPLPDEATVKDFLTYRARLKELRGSRIKEQVEKATRLCDLGGKIMRRPIGVLSRGVRQRVGIADALLTEPPILLLDEPTIGLDPYQVMSLRDLIRGMRGDHTILLSTHILTEAEAMADRILIINKGEKVAFGTPDELKNLYGPMNQLNVCVNLAYDEMKTVLAGICEGIELKSTMGKLSNYLLKAEETAAQEILKKLANCEGVQIKEFSRPTPTLENIFLQATAKKEEVN
jgi:ABC-2 type transport system ATP-binding protein